VEPSPKEKRVAFSSSSRSVSIPSILACRTVPTLPSIAEATALSGSGGSLSLETYVTGYIVPTGHINRKHEVEVLCAEEHRY